jgi:hypothetical protein
MQLPQPAVISVMSLGVSFGNGLGCDLKAEEEQVPLIVFWVGLLTIPVNNRASILETKTHVD